MKTELITLNNIDFEVKIKIEHRHSSRVSISRKSINISVPRFLPREEILKEIEKMKSWAKERILKNPENFKPEQIKSYHDNQEIQVGIEKYILKIEYSNKSSSSAKIKDNIIYLNLSSNLTEERKRDHITSLISRCLASKKLPEVRKRIEELNNLHFKKEIKNIFMKYNHSNWGSCSQKGNINISTRALFAPQDVLDYLYVHELAHLVEQNHSSQFWNLVQKALPDYREKQKWLKENGGNCKF